MVVVVVEVVVVGRYVMELLARVRERKVEVEGRKGREGKGRDGEPGLIFTLPSGIFICMFRCVIFLLRDGFGAASEASKHCLFV